MEELFSISEAAKIANLTSETLRHYDRIGLVKPTKKDTWTKYRYYTRQDIVRLNTVHALTRMDLSLREIREVLDYHDLGKIIAFLERAEKRADEKIAELQYSKEKLRLARCDYERKLHNQPGGQRRYTAEFPKRVILLSDTLETPSLDNLWNYLSHFYGRLAPEIRDSYAFADLAGIYTEKGTSRLFATCLRYGEDAGLKTLPEGTYLCADCTEEERETVISEMMEQARASYHVEPGFVVQIIVISGILRWSYQIQLFLGDSACEKGV